MFIYPYAEVRGWDFEFNTGFYRKVIQQNISDVRVYIEYIDAENVSHEEIPEEVRARLKRLEERIRPDIVISLFPSVNELIAECGNEMFIGIPKIFVMAVPDQVEKLVLVPDSYLIESSSATAIENTLISLHQMLPDLANLIVVCGSSKDDLAYLELCKEALNKNIPDYDVSYFIGLPGNSLKFISSRLPSNTAIMLLPVNMDREGNVFNVKAFVPEFSEEANTPIFTFFDDLFGLGVVGGELTSATIYGDQVADTVLQLLQTGALPEKKQNAATVTKYDWRQLKRWGINEKLLPENSKVLYRSESFFQKNKKQIILILLFISIETILMIMLIINLFNRKKIEKLLIKSEDLLQRSERTAKLGGWDYDLETNKFSCTKGLNNIFCMRTADKLSVDLLLNHIYPEDYTALDSAIREIAVNGLPFEDEFRIITMKGNILWTSIKGEAVRINGKVIRISGSLQDISSKKEFELRLKESLRQKEILLQEIHHRVKNNLAIITSLISMQSDGVYDNRTKGLLKNIQQRINAMALIHEQVYVINNIETVNFKEYIERLVGKLMINYRKQGSPIDILYDIHKKNIDMKYMMPIGLILNEIISNSLEHAFPFDYPGRILIVSNYNKSVNEYSFCIKDNGIGLPKAEMATSGNSLGFLLIRNLVEQINGRMEIDIDNGLSITISFDLL